MSGCPPWSAPPPRLRLGSDEVHVWRAILDLPIERVAPLERTLAPDERAQAGRFRFPRDARRFVVARGVLRGLLGRYLGVDPAGLRFDRHPQGKPRLAAGHDGSGLRFNVSHSQGLALYAVAHGREVGIDLERQRPDLADRWVAEQLFSPPELAALRAAPADRWSDTFFDLWVRTEAHGKARGEGLSLSTDASGWSFQVLDAPAGFAAALAAEGHQWRLLCWDWPG